MENCSVTVALRHSAEAGTSHKHPRGLGLASCTCLKKDVGGWRKGLNLKACCGRENLVYANGNNNWFKWCLLMSGKRMSWSIMSSTGYNLPEKH